MSAKPVPWKRLFAEGLVIVAGVFIALAADRWVQTADEYEQEAAYLAQLLDEFEQTESILLAAAEEAERRQAQAELVLSATDGSLPDSVDAREITLALGLTHWLVNPEIPRNTWQDLVATGHLGLVGSHVRRSIAEFYRYVDQQTGFHAEWLGYISPYRREVSFVLAPELLLAIAQFKIDGALLADELIPSRPELLAAIRSSGLRSPLGEVMTTNWAAAWTYRKLSDASRRIAEELRTELAAS